MRFTELTGVDRGCIILAMGLTDVLLMFILCFLLAGAAASTLIAIRLLRHYEYLSATFREFVSAPAEGQPSPLAIFIDNVGQVLASQITVNLRTSLLGKASGVIRALDGAEADVTEDVLARANPWIAGLMALSPKLTRRLAKSPALAMALSRIQFPGTNGGGLPGEPGRIVPGQQGDFKL